MLICCGFQQFLSIDLQYILTYFLGQYLIFCSEGKHFLVILLIAIELPLASLLHLDPHQKHSRHPAISLPVLNGHKLHSIHLAVDNLRLDLLAHQPKIGKQVFLNTF